uniref:Carbonic anhydrase n=1 Tax=Spumella elongata TaxID=89044 RepID=A0A7S3M860_9STRA|mmetsp:Transcript_37901/g.65476  ORF Transcript_37901/g.65476 Transcript_37901/m.65476 type:complete len:273 (+) Transcript_37901:2-820(+)
MRRVTMVAARRPVPLQARFIQVKKPDFENKFSIAQGASTKQNQHMAQILAGNLKWVDEMKSKDEEFFDKLAQPQKPRYLYFGCADSRVPANEILGLSPGEVFVHRNIGNQVPGNDLNALSVLEYAVQHLKVTDIIVVGHYDCGAVRAATKRQDLGLLENWLRLIRDVYRLHREYIDLITDDERKHLTLVELNVVEQCLNLYKTGVVQRRRNEVREELKAADPNRKIPQDELYPRIHGLVFNPADGILKNLPVDFKKRVGSLDHIYGLIPKKQ